MERGPTLERRRLWSGSKHPHFRGIARPAFLHLENSGRAAARAASRHPARTASALGLVVILTLSAADTITPEERVELIRGLSSEYATTKDFLPRSKKPLPFDADGTYDKSLWAQIGQQSGPAARSGDLIQITRVTLEKDSILLEINGGIKGGGHWYDHVQVGTGNTTSPVARGDSNATSGTYIVLMLHRPLGGMKAADIKKIFKPLLDFDKHSASEMFSRNLPPEVQKAIAEKRAEKGMDRDEVIMSLGRPDRKLRETNDGTESEDWIFGRPPGKIVFVTFENNKVVKVKETYAGLGAEAAAPLEVPHF